MWKKYFKIKGIKPGVIIYPRPFGRIDFRSNNLDINLLRDLVEDDRNLPYLELTEAGVDYFYDDTPDDDNKTDIPGNDPSISSESEEVFTAKELVKLIKESTDQNELSKYYNLGIEYSSVKKAYNKRIEQIYQGS